MPDMVRTHVLLPKKLVEEADQIVGERKRSELVTKLLTEWLRREKQLRAIDMVLAEAARRAAAGIEPEETSEQTAERLRADRRRMSPREQHVQEWIDERIREDMAVK